ncbi:MAG: hypothetical protein JWL65_1820 [Gammaproteobacteria bacterium]|nr:hypothetical protein [Gammaproteobacteria bacterium]
MLRQLTCWALTAIISSVGVSKAAQSATSLRGSQQRPSQVLPSEQRRAFFGDLHLHTALSLDAWGFGTKLLPNDAYRFGRGETVMVPAVQVAVEQGNTGKQDVPARRAWPLDFMAVTDHSESLGTTLPLDDSHSAFAQSELGRKIIAHPLEAFLLKMGAARGQPMPAELHDPEVMRQAWEMVVKAANDNYQPGKFTTFIAYEWSALPQGRNIHRNVIFNADHAPSPFTADESKRPEDLWGYLETIRAQGIDVIAIPHNGNASGGLMYDWNDSDGKPIDEAYAQRRATNEPLTEIVQIKGQSETVPALSPNDEFANFEIYDHLLASPLAKSAAPGSYVRDAFGRGLVIQARIGANPFKYGVVGGSDIHNALSASSENASAGGQFGIDPSTMLPRGDEARRTLGLLPPIDVRSGKEQPEASDDERKVIVERSSAGLTGVWAEQNTRDSIFAALKRKETFATSGSRIRVRMFGGWSYAPDILTTHDWVAQAYAQGVPMGGDLPARPATAAAPTFILQASRDPQGANLDRVQIIKIWLEGSGYQEKIFDAKTGSYRNTIGAGVLTTVWRDPEFDVARPAVYYARVLEIPTPRWSTLLAVKNKLPMSPYEPASIQERAWSSPIWYTPPSK